MASLMDMVKELRERTGAGMGDCKKALAENNNDIEKAIDYLREKGLAAAAKKAGRIAAEGLCDVLVSADGKTGVVVEVNCETDFAAKGERFVEFVKNVSAQALNSTAADLEPFMGEVWAADKSWTVTEAVSQIISTVGENINIRRFERFNKDTKGTFCTYIHGGGKIAVLVDIDAEQATDAVLEAGKNVCLQIAAMLPKFVSRDEVSDEFKEKELAILTAAAQNENKESENPKPEKVLENIVKGRMNKYLNEICLMDQEYVKDNELTVQKYLDAVSKETGFKVAVKRFICFERGEGIERKQENFAEEVAKATGN
ncbi:MAG: translation elongation factor Ts [Defluviitaleaceae bacterium]|nr:translation elongation factor Ts [Defluviitaleaceae bacterium]MCL2835663.1 translation elongation factor Ts [Defluviitaleaceae bacterium]